MNTFGNALDFCAPHIDSGVCPDNEIALSRVNEAIRRLLVKANWKDTLRRIKFYTQNSIITLPREIESVLLVNINCNPKRVFGRHYEFMESGPGGFDLVAPHTSQDLEDVGGGYPTFFDQPEDKLRYIVAFGTSASDIGKKIRIMGRDSLNAEVFDENDALGFEVQVAQWRGGVEGQIDLNISSSIVLPTKQIKSISYVYKPMTAGYVTLYSYDPDTKQLWFLAKYHPSETIPGYRRYKIINPKLPPTALDTSGTYGQNIDCLCKMAYVPAVNRDDILIIQNLDAIKVMCMAISEENARSVQQSINYEAKAVQLLREELRDSNPPDNTRFNVQFHGIGIGDGPNIM